MPDDLSDAQASDVLRRAALLQARSDHARGQGLSLDDLKVAAAAAGIEPEFVEQAYLGAGEEEAPSKPFLGVETGVRRVRVVPGHVSDDEWGRIVLALRREIGDHDTSETIGTVREWKRLQTRIQVEPDGPNTRITATSEWRGDAIALTVGAAVYAAMTALFLGLGGPVALTVLFAILAIGHGAFGWGPVRRRAQKRGPALDRALDLVERLAGADERAEALRSAPPLAETTIAPPEAAARLDSSLLDAEPTEGGGAVPRQRLRG
jgi:hypothetical protein